MSLQLGPSGRVRLAPAVAVLLFALMSGAIIASNMGHMRRITLYKPGDSPVDGTNTLNLPYKLGPGMGDAKNLMDDIGSASVANLSRYVVATNALQTYSGRKNGGVAFPLIAGECYYVKVQGSADLPYDVVGSDDPGKVIDLLQPGAPPSTGDNFVSLPFNCTAKNAKELMDDIGFSQVTSVSRYILATNAFQSYTGRKNGGLAFPIRFDECYLIKMFTTAHYVATRY